MHHIERRHYEMTIDHWLANMHKHADQLKEMVGDQHYRDFRVYLRLARHIQRNVTLDVVVCRRFDEPRSVGAESPERCVSRRASASASRAAPGTT